ncbi:MAG: hypothetical protein ACI4R8_02280 [Candidatus Caccovivens sp.]
MKKSYRTHSFLNGLRFSCLGAIKENKGKILLSFALIFVAICTGIFIAIKSHTNYSLGCLQEINLGDFYTGFVASSSAFFSRSISLTINIIVLTGLSFSLFLFPLAQVLFIYRGYLFGLNFALMFIFYGFGGVFTAVIIVLPCQLLTFFVLVMFYIIFCKLNHNCKRFGNCDCNRFIFVLLAILLVILINLLETLLLLILNGRVILVI